LSNLWGSPTVLLLLFGFGGKWIWKKSREIKDPVLEFHKLLLFVQLLLALLLTLLLLLFALLEFLNQGFILARQVYSYLNHVHILLLYSENGQ
jgi:hypothetical protein